MDRALVIAPADAVKCIMIAGLNTAPIHKVQKKNVGHRMPVPLFDARERWRLRSDCRGFETNQTGYPGSRICLRKLLSNILSGAKRRRRLTWRATLPHAYRRRGDVAVTASINFSATISGLSAVFITS
jgi:hypothetical protein